MIVDNPVYYFERNFVFSIDGSAWVYYETPGFTYDFLSSEDREMKLKVQELIYQQMVADIHLLSVPRNISVTERYERYKKKIRGPLKHEAKTLADRTAEVLAERYKEEGEGGIEYFSYIGIKLPKLKQSTPIKSLKGDFKNRVKGLVKGVKQYFESVSGVDYDITDQQMARYEMAERQVYERIAGRMNLKRVDDHTIQWLIRRNFFRGISDAPLRTNWKPQTIPTDNGFRPLQKDILTLSEGPIHESGRYMTIKQVIDGQEQTGYMAFLTIGSTPDDLEFPGDEWIYKLQTLPFSVEASIRSENTISRDVLKKLRNKNKEFQDMVTHAEQVNETPDEEDIEGLLNSQDLIKEVKKNKMNMLKVSTVLCVSANSLEQLESRVQRVRDLYTNMTITVEQPYGDQFLGFM
jgi:hypothetical protein